MTRFTCRLTVGFAVLLGLLSSTSARAQNAAALYQEHCAGCHDTGVDRAPARDALQTMSAERVLTALENGAMLSMASRMSTADRRALAQFLTGNSLSARDLTMTPPQQAMCTTAVRSSAATGADWNGWGANTATRVFSTARAPGSPPRRCRG